MANLVWRRFSTGWPRWRPTCIAISTSRKTFCFLVQSTWKEENRDANDETRNPRSCPEDCHSGGERNPVGLKHAPLPVRGIELGFVHCRHPGGSTGMAPTEPGSRGIVRE